MDEASAADVAARMQAMHQEANQALQQVRQSHTVSPPSEPISGNAGEVEERVQMKKDIEGLKAGMARIGTNITAFMSEMRDLVASEARTYQTGGRTPSIRGDEEDEEIPEDDPRRDNGTGVGNADPPAFAPPPPLNFHRQLGEPQQPVVPALPEASLVPTMRVSEALKRKILAGEFVEMADLLDGKTEETAPQLPDWFQCLPGVKTDTASKKILTVADWISAFHKYIYVLVTASKSYKEEFGDMMAYMNEVLRIAKEGKDWLEYDRSFRLERADQPVGSKMRWSFFHSYNYQHLKRIDHKQGTSNFRGLPRGSGHSQSVEGYSLQGHCFDYHAKDRRCANPITCKYRHRCPIANCGETHPVYVHDYAKYQGRRRDNRRGRFDGGQSSGGKRQEKPANSN